LGQKPERLHEAHLGKATDPIKIEVKPASRSEKTLVGVDVFIDWIGETRNPDELGHALEALAGDNLKLKMITNRGVKVYPGGIPETFCTDHWRCRFVSYNSSIKSSGNGMSNSVAIPHSEVVQLLNRLTNDGLNFIKIENLYEIDGVRGYSLGQGE